MAQTIREQVEAILVRMSTLKFKDGELVAPKLAAAVNAEAGLLLAEHAELFAAAQETADERDALAAYAAQVREALERIDSLLLATPSAAEGLWPTIRAALSLTPPDAVGEVEAEREIHSRLLKVSVALNAYLAMVLRGEILVPHDDSPEVVAFRGVLAAIEAERKELTK